MLGFVAIKIPIFRPGPWTGIAFCHAIGDGPSQVGGRSVGCHFFGIALAHGDDKTSLISPDPLELLESDELGCHGCSAVLCCSSARLRS